MMYNVDKQRNNNLKKEFMTYRELEGIIYEAKLFATNKTTKNAYYIDKNAPKLLKLLKHIKKEVAKVQEKIDIINVSNCLTDATNRAILYNVTKDKNGNDIKEYKYTIEGDLKRRSEIEAYLEKVNEEIERLYEEEIPSDLIKKLDLSLCKESENLTEYQKELFKGLFID